MAVDTTSTRSGFSWLPDETLTRTSHALDTGDGVWLIDPVDVPEAIERVAALGAPAGVLQLLDRHNRDCAAIAARARRPAPAPAARGPRQPVRGRAACSSCRAGTRSRSGGRSGARSSSPRRSARTTPTGSATVRPGMHLLLRPAPPGALRGYAARAPARRPRPRRPRPGGRGRARQDAYDALAPRPSALLMPRSPAMAKAALADASLTPARGSGRSQRRSRGRGGPWRPGSPPDVHHARRGGRRRRGAERGGGGAARRARRARRATARTASRTARCGGRPTSAASRCSRFPPASAT